VICFVSRILMVECERSDDLFFNEHDEFLPGSGSSLAFGDRSLLMTRERLALLRSAAPAHAPWIVIPDAGHHIMVDQPLALVAALRALLAAWQPDATLHGDELR